MEDINDTDQRHAKRGKYHDLDAQKDKYLLADVIENFQKMCLKICGLEPAHFLLHLNQHDKQPQKRQKYD